MGAGALVNPRFFNERARSERHYDSPRHREEIGRPWNRPPSASAAWIKDEPPRSDPSSAWSRVQLAFTLERLPRPTGLSGESRHRYLVSVPWKYPPISKGGVGQTGSSVMLMRGDRSWEQHPNDTPSEYLPSSSSNYKLGSTLEPDLSPPDRDHRPILILSVTRYCEIPKSFLLRQM